MNSKTKIETWINEVMDTAIYPNKGKNIIYPALGLGECGEIAKSIRLLRGILAPVNTKATGKKLRTEELLSELGDLSWYIAAMYYELKPLLSKGKTFEDFIGFGVVETSDRAFLNAVESIGLIQNQVKKTIRDDGGKLTLERGVKIYNLLNDLMNAFICLCNGLQEEFKQHIHVNLSFFSVIEYNLKKLSKRQEQGTIKGDGDNR